MMSIERENREEKVKIDKSRLSKSADKMLTQLFWKIWKLIKTCM